MGSRSYNGARLHAVDHFCSEQEEHLKDGQPQVMQPEKAIWVFRMYLEDVCCAQEW
jgi:hypothetical protein